MQSGSNGGNGVVGSFPSGNRSKRHGPVAALLPPGLLLDSKLLAVGLPPMLLDPGIAFRVRPERLFALYRGYGGLKSSLIPLVPIQIRRAVVARLISDFCLRANETFWFCSGRGKISSFYSGIRPGVTS